MTQRFTQTAVKTPQAGLPSTSSRPARCPQPTTVGEGRKSVGYIVSTGPRLSQTFVLTGVLALERREVRVRIFSLKDPSDEPVHGDAGRVRAKVAYLSLPRHRMEIIQSNLS